MYFAHRTTNNKSTGRIEIIGHYAYLGIYISFLYVTWVLT